MASSKRRTPGVIALLIALVCAAVGAGLIAFAVTHPLRVAEKPASGLIISVSNCYKQTCGYDISYQAEGILRDVTIPGPQNSEPGPGSVTTVYYQVAHPTVARFSNTGYANDWRNAVIGFGVILILVAVVFALAGGVRLAVALTRARRLNSRPSPGQAG
jgi:hypothetical protein